MTEIPFARTVCGCAGCVSCCQTQPGYLLPGDFERIAAHLGETPEAARQYFCASPGALVGDIDSGRRWRIGTITPKIVRKKGCVFLDSDNKCRIHAVAPFGCAYFDMHMNGFQGDQRSMWGLRQIIDNPAYRALRALLPFK